MSHKNRRFYKKEIKKIVKLLFQLNKRLSNLLFNKIHINEAIEKLDEIENRYYGLRSNLNQESEFERARIILKNEDGLKKINKLFKSVKKIIDKKSKGKIPGKIKRSKPKASLAEKSIDPYQEKPSQPTPNFNSINSKGPFKIKNPSGIVVGLHQETIVHRSVINSIRKIHTRLLDPISGRLDPPTKKVSFVWHFNLAVYDKKQICCNVPVEMHGSRLKGRISEGDTIQIEGRWKLKSGEKIEVHKIYNNTKKGYVKAVGSTILTY